MQRFLALFLILGVKLPRNPLANIAAIDYDPGASDVNQLNRIKLMMATAYKNMERNLSEQDRKKMEPVVFDKAE